MNTPERMCACPYQCRCHYEMYVSDARKTASEKQKTAARRPRLSCIRSKSVTADERNGYHASFWVPFESLKNRLTKGQDTRCNRDFSFWGTETVEQQSAGRIGAAGRHAFGGVLCIYTEGERKPPSFRAGLVRSDRKIEHRLKNRRPQNKNEFKPYRSREFPKQAYWGLRKSPFGLVKHAF